MCTWLDADLHLGRMFMQQCHVSVSSMAVTGSENTGQRVQGVNSCQWVSIGASGKKLPRRPAADKLWLSCAATPCSTLYNLPMQVFKMVQNAQATFAGSGAANTDF